MGMAVFYWATWLFFLMDYRKLGTFGEILQKYKSIETNNPRIAFNASEFSEGKKMFFL